MKGYMEFDLPIHVLEIQSTLDSLKYNLGNLQYSNDYEKLKPEILSATARNGSHISVTILNQKLSINAALICLKLNLRVLDLDTLSLDLKRPIVLHLK